MYLRYKQKLMIGITLLVVACLLISSIYVYSEFFNKEEETVEEEPEDAVVDDRISPLADQVVSLEINRIRKKGMEEKVRKIGNSWKNKPSFHYAAYLNDIEWSSGNINAWDTGYVDWEIFRLIENETEECDIEIKIVETKKKLFSSSDEVIESLQIVYDFKTGHWTGDDFLYDTDGYGHFNGENYEIWFDIHQTDYDGDKIPYWTEVNVLHTDPMVDDSFLDPDMDGIPSVWEWKWGYDPFVYDNHSTIDPELDGLSNIVEYQLEKWLANPYQKEIYLEVDFMEKGPGLFASEHVLYEETKQILMDKFNEHGITMHFDDGCMGGGGEYFPFYERITQDEGIVSDFYKNHFDDDRKGVFHYVFIQNRGGWCHPQDSKLRYDCMAVPTNLKWRAKTFSPPAITPRLLRLTTAIAIMHELGHSLGLMPTDTAGNDNASHVGRNNLPPFQKMQETKRSAEYWSDYVSCMNYAKFSKYILDYSDGSNGERDFDDWSDIDLTYFQKPSPDSTEGIQAMPLCII